MGEFHDAVTTLIEAFSRGLAVIKRKRTISSSNDKRQDLTLRKSLKRSRSDVQTAYGREMGRVGPGFANGDAEAYSSLSAILFRLNAGFVSVIERFTRGHNTSTDYAALLSLSNSARSEAIQTFSQLSMRLSKSSLTLVPPITSKQATNSKSSHRKKGKKSSPAGDRKYIHSKSAPSVLVTPEGVVRRPKHSRSKSTPSSKPQLPATKKSTSPKPSPKSTRSPTPQTPSPPYELNASQHSLLVPYMPPYQPRTPNRKSIMSFASDSTKLGEIPEHKWAARDMPNGQMVFPIRTYYPLEPYQQPVKQKSKLRRLFGL